MTKQVKKVEAVEVKKVVKPVKDSNSRAKLALKLAFARTKRINKD